MTPYLQSTCRCYLEADLVVETGVEVDLHLGHGDFVVGAFGSGTTGSDSA